MYLDRATFVTGEVLHVDGGVHAGKVVRLMARY
jgi:enoyl-[acyl-carrier-protein] reductase (NADH)